MDGAIESSLCIDERALRNYEAQNERNDSKGYAC
jgi:hypothetical protein